MNLYKIDQTNKTRTDGKPHFLTSEFGKNMYTCNTLVDICCYKSG